MDENRHAREIGTICDTQTPDEYYPIGFSRRNDWSDSTLRRSRFCTAETIQEKRRCSISSRKNSVFFVEKNISKRICFRSTCIAVIAIRTAFHPTANSSPPTIFFSTFCRFATTIYKSNKTNMKSRSSTSRPIGSLKSFHPFTGSCVDFRQDW